MRLDAAIDQFGEFWRSHAIPSRSLGLHNVSVQELEDASLRLVLIDGFGSTEFIPISRLSRSYAVRKCERKIRVLRREVLENLESRENGGSPLNMGILLYRE